LALRIFIFKTFFVGSYEASNSPLGWPKNHTP